jgi:SAM-dependent methyltransferase
MPDALLDAAAAVCPVCGGDRCEPFAEARDVEYHTIDEVFRYVACRTCGVVFLPDPPVDRLAQIYPPNYYSYRAEGPSSSWIRRVKDKLDARGFERLLRDIPGDSLRVLDVGGGTGWRLSLIRAACPRVSATHEVELDDRARAAAEAAGHVFHASGVERFHGERSFDLILLLNLIEHVADPGAVLRSMRDALSDRGRLIVQTPNTDTLDCRLFRKHSWAGLHCPRHWVLFTRASFIALAERCGLRCEQERYTQGGYQWAASILARLAERGLVEVSAERPVDAHPAFFPLAGAMAAVDYLRAPFAPTAQMLFTLKRA